jgi:hypothetical protein
MRKLAFVASALLAACSTAPAEPPVHGVTPGHKCNASGTDKFIGLPGTVATGQAILRASNAAVLRVAEPNTMLTMDYREDRVTIWLDQAQKITKIRCG